MTIEHVNITDPQIHEPKGTATAQTGHVYVANGAGSGAWAPKDSAAELANRVVVTQASDLASIDSTKEYFIDGTVDMGSQSIEVPAGGINLKGYNLGLSKLISTASSYTLFTSPAGGSGNVLGMDISFEVSGTASRVYNLVGNTGFEAIEFVRLNYDNCTSLGTIDNYRQGLEQGTGRFGGSPSLTLAGAWLGGFRITASIVRSLDAGMTEPLFKAGAAFIMNSRFLTDMNVDLPALAPLLDFTNSNFPNTSSLQLHDMILTRDGVNTTGDTNITPNISASELASSFQDNIGIPNTFVGGELDITVEAPTVIATAGVFVDVAGTWAPENLVHFDVPAAGQLRHIGTSPQEYTVFADVILDSVANDEVDLKVVIYRAATTNFEDSKTVRRVINSLQGGRNVAAFTLRASLTLGDGDYIKLQVANVLATNNITAEIDSYLEVEER